MRTTATWIALSVLGLAAAGCQQKAAAPATETAAAPAKAVPAVPAVPAAPAAAVPAPPAVPPETVLAVTQALAAAQAFNAKTAEDLAAVGKAEKRIHDLAAQATADAAKAGAGQENARLALGRQVANARTEAEAAHADMASRLATFRATSQAQTDAVAQAVLLCATPPEVAAPEPCLKLIAEQATLTKSVADLTARFATAEASYQKDRARLEEASATMALGIR